jgi:hypothetical protein
VCEAGFVTGCVTELSDTACLLYSQSAMLLFCHRNLAAVLSLSFTDPVCDTALYDVMFFHSDIVPSWTDRWHKNYVSLFGSSARFKNKEDSETPVTNSYKFTAFLFA